MNIFLKALIFLALFSLLHFGYQVTRWPYLKPFCGLNESIFQHLKMAYWAYLLTSLIEFPIAKKRKINPLNFWIPRFLSAIFLPWIIFLIWYLGPALIGKLNPSYLELIWAVTVTYLSVLSVRIIEKHFENIQLSFCFNILVFLLLIISALLYIAFSYQLPWIDVFKPPEIF